MKNHLSAIAAALLAISAVFASAPDARAQDVLFSTTEIQLHHGDGYHLGRNGFDTTARSMVRLENFTLFDVGDSYFFVDLFYDHEGPGREADHYGEVWAHLNGGLFGLDLPADGFVADIGPGLGLNHSTDFLVLAPGVRAKFNVPGFDWLSLGAYAYQNVVDPFDRDLDTTYQVTAAWNAPFHIAGERFWTQGFVDFIGEQGSGFDSQIVFAPQVRWDVGEPGGLSVGFEYTHFKNKYGVSGLDDNSISAIVAMQF